MPDQEKGRSAPDVGRRGVGANSAGAVADWTIDREIEAHEAEYIDYLERAGKDTSREMEPEC